MKKILRSGADKVFLYDMPQLLDGVYLPAGGYDDGTAAAPFPAKFSSDTDVPQKEQKAVVCPLCAEITPATLTPYDSVFKPQPMAGFGFGGT